MTFSNQRIRPVCQARISPAQTIHRTLRRHSQPALPIHLIRAADPRSLTLPFHHDPAVSPARGGEELGAFLP